MVSPLYRLGVLQWDDGRRYDGGFGAYFAQLEFCTEAAMKSPVVNVTTVETIIYWYPKSSSILDWDFPWIMVVNNNSNRYTCI